MFKPQAMFVAALALAGCAAIQGQGAADSEEILAQAGFRREAATISAQGATRGAEQGLKVRQLTAQNRGGETTYAFYDPDFCRCTFVGGASEYAKLQELRSARQAEHAWAVRAYNVSGSSPDASVWGAWKPRGLDLK